MIPHTVPEWNCLVKGRALTDQWILASFDLLFIAGSCLVNITALYFELRSWRANESTVKNRTATVLGVNLRNAFNLICLSEIFFWIRNVACSYFLNMNNSLTQCIFPVVIGRIVRWIWEITKIAFIIEITHYVTHEETRNKLHRRKEIGLLLGIWIAGIVLSLSQIISGTYEFQRNVLFSISRTYNTCIFWIHVLMSFIVLIYSSVRLDRAKKNTVRQSKPPEFVNPITDTYRYIKRLIAADLLYYSITIIADVCFALGLSRNAWVTSIAKINTNVVLTYETFLCASIFSPSKLTERTRKQSRVTSESREELVLEPLGQQNSEIMTTVV